MRSMNRPPREQLVLLLGEVPLGPQRDGDPGRQVVEVVDAGLELAGLGLAGDGERW